MGAMRKISSDEKTVRKLRSTLSETLENAVRGQITYVTSNGRRIAAVVPLVDAEAIDDPRENTPDQEPAPADS